jgi:hypothetical protein
VDETEMNRLTCEDWLTKRRPVRQAMVLSMLAAGLLSVGLMTRVRRPLWRRGFLAFGLLACIGCLGWSATEFHYRAILHEGALVSDGSEAILWAASLAMGLGLGLTLLWRDAFIALAGSLVSSVGFVVVERCWPTLPNVLAGDARLSCPVLATVSAYAALALAWSMAVLTLGRLVLAPPSGERLRAIAARCARSIGMGLVLLAAEAILGVFATEPGDSCRGWDAPALRTFFVLPGCVLLLYARRMGWLKPFGLLVGSALAFTAIVMAWHILCRGTWDGHAAFDLAANAWLYGVCLVNLSLIAHAALRYYFGKQRVPV